MPRSGVVFAPDLLVSWVPKSHFGSNFGAKVIGIFPYGCNNGIKGSEVFMTLSCRTWLTFVFFIAALVLYAYGVVSASHIPAEVDAIALPFDFMVGIPLAFYLVVVRPRKLSPLCVIPVIWVGYGLSVVALGSPDTGILPLVLAALIPVELVIAIREMQRMARVYKDAKANISDPMRWLYVTTLYLVRKEMPARMMATELSVWYYALFSWRKKPSVEGDKRAYSYHNAGGYVNMLLGLGLAFPVEIVTVHMLLAQWSVAAATVATLLSIYAAVWLLGDARARILRPVILSRDELCIECGVQMEAIVPVRSVAGVSSSEPENLEKSDKLNYGAFYQANVWITFERPIEVQTLMGTKCIRAVGLSLDDPQRFRRDWENRL